MTPSLNILVLGGTSFVGRAIVADLTEREHHVTLFSRGKTNPDLFKESLRLLGDRETGDYASLNGTSWDAVVDVSGYVPRHVNQALDAVGEVGRYLFISTGSVYSREGVAPTGMAEDSPRLTPWRDSEVIDSETYGPLKVACEDDITSRLGSSATIVRPGIVAGPHDTTDRFTYWVRRAHRGPAIGALPGRLGQPVQVVDSRDLARLVTLLLEQDRPGTFNAVGPATPVTIADLVAACAAAAGTSLHVVEVDQVLGGDSFPLVLADPTWDPFFRRSAAAAHEVGMPQTPLVQTARDVLAWDLARGLPELLTGWSLEQEQAALANSSARRASD